MLFWISSKKPSTLLPTPLTFNQAFVLVNAVNILFLPLLLERKGNNASRPIAKTSTDSLPFALCTVVRVTISSNLNGGAAEVEINKLFDRIPLNESILDRREKYALAFRSSIEITIMS